MVKKNKLTTTAIIALLASSFMGATYAVGNDYNIANMYSYQDLNTDEENGILLMREEEKLARDVYLTLYDKYQVQVFSNIANSEQRHMDSILNLIDKYNLTDPISNDEVGVFSNQEYQDLYNQLVEQGSSSEIEALKVGASIEDLDIKDLDEWINKSNNDDFIATFKNLEKGSRNHMRSFIGTLDNYRENYNPQFISEEYYNEIISSDMERGMMYGRNGQVVMRMNESNMHQYGNGMQQGGYMNRYQQANMGNNPNANNGYGYQQANMGNNPNTNNMNGNQQANNGNSFTNSFSNFFRNLFGWFK